MQLVVSTLVVYRSRSQVCQCWASLPKRIKIGITIRNCIDRGTTQIAVGNWNRIKKVDNGQSGTVDLTYQNIWQATGQTYFDNNRRLTARGLRSGQSHGYPIPVPDVYTYTYSYSHPAYNWLGTAVDDPSPPGEKVNSAALLYAVVTDTSRSTTKLMNRPYTEFRGHAVVTETLPTGNYNVSYFYQGDIGCNPNKDSNCSFAALRDQEQRVGMAYRSQSYQAPSGVKLAQTDNSYAVCVNDPNNGNAGSGIIRAFSYQSQQLDTSYDQSGLNPRSKTTNYSYDVSTCPYDWPPNPNGPSVFGNLTQVEEKDNAGVTLRRTTHSYAANGAGNTYIVDRPASDSVYNAGSSRFAQTFYTYDGTTTVGAVGTHGDLYRMFKSTDAYNTGNTLNGQGVTYGYDSYGNQNSATSYTGLGTATWNGSNWSVNATGGTARTTTTTYDNYYHALPTQINHPIIGSEYAGYDWRMQTITSITDVGGNITSATYDTFGRLASMTKPGDGANNPTEAYYYYDNNYQMYGQPFKYTVWKYENQSGNYRPIQQFYDGLGRLIQSKAASITKPSFAQNIVEDKIYDGVGQLTQDSQPRYVSETLPQFGNYTPISDNTTERWTTTAYDGLGRSTSVTAPDNTVTTMSYLSAANGPATVSNDAKNHDKQMEYDVFGRLTAVREYTSTGTANLYATTVYTYNPLDLLTQTRDQLGNSVSMGYDTLGRKMTMTDPDMGSYSYQYDGVGNLTKQIGPTATITFTYDNLDRLTGKTYSNGDAATSYSYDQRAAVGNGNKGQRTGMSRAGNVTAWNYNARGLVQNAGYTVGARGPFTFTYAYDTGDRVTTLNYGGFELLTYSYDDAWRQKGLTSNYGGAATYVSSASYNALSQPISMTLGNGVVNTYSYNNVMSRLDNLKVGTPGGGYGNYFNRSYQYDNVGNVQSITNNISSEVQTFSYDPLDRLTNWQTTTGVNQPYSYDQIGNLVNKNGTAFLYGSNLNGTGTGPHQLRNIGGISTLTYNAAGNMTQDTSLNYNWNAENQLTSVSGTSSESYSYDADGTRASRTVGSITTVYLGALYEADNDAANTSRRLYQFGGTVVAQRTINSGGSTFIYLHGDHLGSISMTTDGVSGSYVSGQEFDPWGGIRSGNVPETKLNYTGQRKDATGLLYYGARYYNPATGRFISADTIVPGMAMAVGGSLGTLGMDKNTSHKSLTVDYHEPGFASAVAGENGFTFGKGFWFQLSNRDRQQAKTPYGPLNPQALNRYSYVLNNPIRYTDPTGRVWMTTDQFNLFLMQAEQWDRHMPRVDLGLWKGAVVLGAEILGNLAGIAMCGPCTLFGSEAIGATAYALIIGAVTGGLGYAMMTSIEASFDVNQLAAAVHDFAYDLGDFKRDAYIQCMCKIDYWDVKLIADGNGGTTLLLSAWSGNGFSMTRRYHLGIDISKLMKDIQGMMAATNNPNGFHSDPQLPARIP